MPKPLTSNNKARGQFDRSAFKYVKDDDEYECPAEERLTYRFTGNEKGKDIRRYWSSACPQCPIKDKCTTAPYRRVSRWVHEDILEVAEAMRIRKAVVEHPYGTIKHWMGSNHFLTKKMAGVSTEMSLHVLAYNMKRVLKLVGAERLLEAM